MLQALNTGHEGSLVTVHANSLRRRDPPPRDARDDERPAHPVRGAARPDQLRDRRDRADRPLRRRQPPRSPRSRSSPPAGARRSGSATVARFEADPVGPDRKVTGRFRHFPLPPAIARRLMLHGRGGAAPSSAEAEADAHPRARGATDAQGRRTRSLLLLGVLVLALLRHRRCSSAAPPGAPRWPPAARDAATTSALRALLRRARRARCAAPQSGGGSRSWLRRRGRARWRRSTSSCSCSPAAFLALAAARRCPDAAGRRVRARLIVGGRGRRAAGSSGSAAKRRDAFIDQLPDLARVLSNGASAGLSLAGAIQLAARELHEPAAGEMRAVVEEMRVGQPVDARARGAARAAAVARGRRC